MDRQTHLTAILLVFLIVPHASGQKSYDEKLRSMYKLSVPLIHPDELVSLMEKEPSLVLLDTRTQEEFNVSHLHSARFIDYDTYSDNMVKSLSPDTPIVVYCAVGYRSERIGEKLIAKGFKNVKNLYGGIFEWVNESHPVENNRGVPTDSVHTYSKEWSRWLIRGKKVY